MRIGCDRVAAMFSLWGCVAMLKALVSRPCCSAVSNAYETACTRKQTEKHEAWIHNREELEYANSTYHRKRSIDHGSMNKSHDQYTETDTRGTGRMEKNSAQIKDRGIRLHINCKVIRREGIRHRRCLKNIAWAHSTYTYTTSSIK